MDRSRRTKEEKTSPAKSKGRLRLAQRRSSPGTIPQLPSYQRKTTGEQHSRHNLTLNLQNLVQFQQADDLGRELGKVQSPARSTGRFQNASDATTQGQVAQKKKQSDDDDGKAGEGYEELDPLVPRQSSVIQKIQMNYENAAGTHGSRSSYGGRQSEHTLKNTNSSNGRVHASSRNVQATSFNPSVARNTNSALSHSNQVKSVNEYSDYNESRQERDTLLVQAESQSQIDAERDLLSTRARQFYQAHAVAPFDQDGSTDHDNQTVIARMTPLQQQQDDTYFPENKSLSPNPGQRRYTNLLPNPMSGSQDQKIASQKVTSDFYIKGVTTAVRPFESSAISVGGAIGGQQLTFRERKMEQDRAVNNSKVDQNRLNHRTESPLTKIPMQMGLKKTVTIDNSRRDHSNELLPAKTSSDQPKIGAHQKRSMVSRSTKHQYFMDISDLVSVLGDCAKLLQRTNLDSFVRTAGEQAAGEANLSSQIQSVIGGDKEAGTMLKFIEEKTGITTQQFLLLHKADYRVYQIEDSSLLTSVYFNHAKDHVCTALLKMTESITEYIERKFKGRKGTARLGFSSEKELFNIFHLQMFSSEVFGQVGINSSRNVESFYVPRRIMGELWHMIQLFRHINFAPPRDSALSPTKTLHKQIQLTFQLYPAKTMMTYLATKLLLHCRGRALFCSERKSFPLHKAVFEGNLPLISRLITCKQDGVLFVDKNEIDPCGNSALTLAIRLRNIDAVKILTDLYCSAKLNPFPQVLSPLEMAKTIKDRRIVEVLMNSMQKVKQHYLEVHKDAIFRVLERLPDFSIDLHFECTSNFIPWMKHLAPTDTYHIFKQGSNLRLDMRFLGYQKLKAIESNISVLFKGRNSGASEGELLLVDHDQGRVISIFEDTTSAKIEKDLDNIMADQDIQKKYRAEKVKIEPECDRKGNIITQVIDDFSVQKYSVSSTYTMTKFKLNNRHVEMLTKYKTFEEYLKVMKVDLLSLGNPTVSARRDRDIRQHHQNSFALNDSLVMPQISSRPNINHAQQPGQISLLADLNVDPGTHLQTLGDFGVDQRNQRDSQLQQPCQSCMQRQNLEERKSETVRDRSCNCDAPSAANPSASTFGLTPIITKSNRRTFSASMWLCQDHPLSIETFLPLLQVLSFSSKQIRKLEQAIDRYDLPRDRFPLKAKVPVFMLVEATFQFQALQFGRQPDDVFRVDEQVIQQKRESLKQHYQLLQSQGRGVNYTFQSEEDVRRQNQTLTKLYKQLSLADERGGAGDNSRDESSLSDGIELAYQEMIENLDETSKELGNRSHVLLEESKGEIVMVGKEEHPLCKPVQEHKTQSDESVRSSMERLTPANEYDVIIDSASNTFRAQQKEQVPTVSEPPVAAQQLFEVDQQQIKTARQEQVKTMSQINQRHERSLFSSNGTAADAYISTITHFRSKSRPDNETEQQYREKLEANQLLIERLTGRPLAAQLFDKHAVSLSDQDKLLKDGISLQTAFERKKRRKEQIRLYKLMKTSFFAKKDSKKGRIQDFMSKTLQDGSGIFLSKSREMLSENIMDSRVVDDRPDVNETVEKRKLITYNNPAMLDRAATQSSAFERGSTDTEGANANLMLTKRSSGAMQPPQSFQKKEAGFASTGSQEKQRHEAVLGGTVGHVLKQAAGQSTADDSSGGQSDGNYFSTSQKSHNSLTKSLPRQHVSSKSKTAATSDQARKQRSSREQLRQTLQPSGTGLLSWLSSQATSALRRRQEDQNHLHTIESEEVYGTEGTQAHSTNQEPFTNPYHDVNNFSSANKRLYAIPGDKSRQQPDSSLLIRQKNNSSDLGSLSYGLRINQKAMTLTSMLSRRSQGAAPQALSQSMLTNMSQEERDKLQNPNQVLNRIHQFVVGGGGDLVKGKQSMTLETRKKQRGHTSYVSGTSKLQDAGALSPELLLGPSYKSKNQKRLQIDTGVVTAQNQEFPQELVATRRTSQTMSLDPHQRTANSLQVLLTKKPPTTSAAGAAGTEKRHRGQVPRQTNAESYLEQKRQTSDVDIAI